MRAKALIDSTKVKITWLLPKDMVYRIKRYALDNETNATNVAIEAFEMFFASKSKGNGKK